MLHISNDCSTIEDVYFCVRAGCKVHVPLVSYGTKHSLSFVSDEPFVCSYTHNLQTTGCMAVQHIKRLLYYQRHS